MDKLSEESPHVRQEKTLRTDGLLKHLSCLTQEDLYVCMAGSVNMGLMAYYPIATIGLCIFSVKIM